jgi:hypothetical protein
LVDPLGSLEETRLDDILGQAALPEDQIGDVDRLHLVLAHKMLQAGQVTPLEQSYRLPILHGLPKRGR